MRQNASPKLAAAVIGVVVLIAAAAVMWAWRAPSVTGTTTENTGPGPANATNVDGSKKTGPRFTNEQVHGGPSPEQLQQIQEWKKAHPGATTKY